MINLSITVAHGLVKGPEQKKSSYTHVGLMQRPFVHDVSVIKCAVFNVHMLEKLNKITQFVHCGLVVLIVILIYNSLLTRHPVRGEITVNDLILQVDGGNVFWVGHSDGQQDAHQQVDNLRRRRRKRHRLFKLIGFYLK